MPFYFVKCESSDVRRQERLHAEFKFMNAVEVFDSTWFLKLKDSSATKVRNHLRQFIGPDDQLLVTEVADWAVQNLTISPEMQTTSNFADKLKRSAS